MDEVRVISPAGKSGTVKLSRLSDAVSKGGYKLADPDQEVPVINPTGRKGSVPILKLHSALTQGGYSLRPVQSDTEVAAKALGSGALSLVDTPQNIGEILGDGNHLKWGSATPFEAEFEQVPVPSGILSSKIKEGIKHFTGFDLEPHPSNKDQELIADITGMAGSFLPFGAAAKGANLLTRFGKTAGAGAAIGGTSGLLKQEGVDPLVADISAGVVMPLAGAGGKNLLGRFSNLSAKGYENTIKNKTGEILKEKIREKNIPKVLAKLDTELPLRVNATTAELAENPGLARLHQTLAPNIPEIAEQQAAGDTIIRKQLKNLSPATDLYPERVGEVVQKNLSDNLDNYLKTRSTVSEPLYEKVKNLNTPVPLHPFNQFIMDESKFAKGDIKKNLDYLKNVVGKNNKGSGSNNFSLGGSKFDLDQLGPKAQLLIQNELAGAPLPGEIQGAIKDINNKIGKAVNKGSREEARILGLGKDTLLESMAHIPEEQIARSTYAKLSKNVNAIEKEPLLSKFVKKDLEKAFILSPEKIPDLVLKGSLNNTKALIKQVGDNKKTMDAIRGSIVNKMLSSSELSSINAAGEGNLSYDKFNKFLKNNKDKLNLFFDKDQVKVLEDINEILKRRSMVSTLSRASGSPTQSNLTLLDSLASPVGSITKKTLSGFPGSKYVMMFREAAKNREQAHINKLIEKALVDPQTAKLLLTPLKDIKDPKVLNRIYDPKLVVPLMNKTREETDGL